MVGSGPFSSGKGSEIGMCKIRGTREVVVSQHADLRFFRRRGHIAVLGVGYLSISRDDDAAVTWYLVCT